MIKILQSRRYEWSIAINNLNHKYESNVNSLFNADVVQPESESIQVAIDAFIVRHQLSDFANPLLLYDPIIFR